MENCIILQLLVLASIVHFTGCRKLWASSSPTSANVWRSGWRISHHTYRGKESVKAKRSPDGQKVNVAEIHLAKGSYGLTRRHSGAEFYSAPLKPRKCVTLAYSVWFKKGFNFAYGGKLPGLYGGGVSCTAGTDPGKDCFTTRFIWRTGGVGGFAVFSQVNQPGRFCKSKDVECNPGWGHRLASGRFKFKTGRWYRLQQTMSTNSVGKANGYIRLSVGGIGKIYETKNFMIRKSGISVDGIFFSNFFGGTSSCSASPVNTYTYFKNFVLSDDFC